MWRNCSFEVSGAFRVGLWKSIRLGRGDFVKHIKINIPMHLIQGGFVEVPKENTNKPIQGGSAGSHSRSHSPLVSLAGSPNAKYGGILPLAFRVDLRKSIWIISLQPNIGEYKLPANNTKGK